MNKPTYEELVSAIQQLAQGSCDGCKTHCKLDKISGSCPACGEYSQYDYETYEKLPIKHLSECEVGHLLARLE